MGMGSRKEPQAPPQAFVLTSARLVSVGRRRSISALKGARAAPSLCLSILPTELQARVVETGLEKSASSLLCLVDGCR
jgi:hypothetical protein